MPLQQPEIARCEAEIAQALEYLRSGGPDEAGAFLGLLDWRSELELIKEKHGRQRSVCSA